MKESNLPSHTYCPSSEKEKGIEFNALLSYLYVYSWLLCRKFFDLINEETSHLRKNNEKVERLQIKHQNVLENKTEKTSCFAET